MHVSILCYYVNIPKFVIQDKENIVKKVWGRELWYFSDREENPSYIRLDGRVISFSELIKAHRKEIIGSEKYVKFPILVKLLEINSKISVQVHPTDEIARKLGEKESGKEEVWLLLDRGKIYIGFKRDVRVDELDCNEILEKMNKFDGDYLDLFKIGAGVVHYAEKVKILEVSNNSNITYRLCDFFGRRTEPDKVLKAINMKKTDRRSILCRDGKALLGKFILEILQIDDTKNFFNEGGFSIFIPIEDKVTIKYGNELLTLLPLQPCLIPASTTVYEVIGSGGFSVRISAKGE